MRNEETVRCWKAGWLYGVMVDFLLLYLSFSSFCLRHQGKLVKLFGCCTITAGGLGFHDISKCILFEKVSGPDTIV